MTAGGRLFTQVPIANIPYPVELGTKGFNDGMMPYYQPLIREDGEFHHTVPPPIRIPVYTQKTVTITKPKQQMTMQNVQHKSQRYPERVRISAQKYTPNQQIKTRPVYSPQSAPSQAHPNKELKHHIPTVPVYKYPLVLQSSPQNTHYSEYPENNFDEEIYRRPVIKKVRINQNSASVPQYSEEYGDSEEKVPEWKLKPNGGAVRDTSHESNTHYYKKQKLQRPEQEDSKYYDEDTDGSFSYEDQFKEVPPNFNRYNKHYSPVKSNAGVHNKPKHELKKTREPIHENLKQYHYQSKPTSVEFFSSKDITDTFPFISKEENHKHSLQYNTQSTKKAQEFTSPKIISGSEWIPINAPEGALPAKSYDIPAPDLSRGHPQWSNSQEVSLELDDISTRDQRLGNVVYGGRKQQRTGVVSASVMVKQ
uniref:Uncharacterized protein n=1 Tax=Rhodnius prolixus TaxID=13249 RepID=T1HJ67_RHOPR